jgi:hypothetical protein
VDCGNWQDFFGATTEVPTSKAFDRGCGPTDGLDASNPEKRLELENAGHLFFAPIMAKRNLWQKE